MEGISRRSRVLVLAGVVLFSVGGFAFLAPSAQPEAESNPTTVRAPTAHGPQVSTTGEVSSETPLPTTAPHSQSDGSDQTEDLTRGARTTVGGVDNGSDTETRDAAGNEESSSPPVGGGNGGGSGGGEENRSGAGVVGGSAGTGGR